MCSLGIKPTTFALLTQCSTTEPQEHRLHKLTDFINGDKGKLGIIHYVTEDHTLPDFTVVPITMNSRRNVRLVARRRMTNENICVLKISNMFDLLRLDRIII